MKENEHIYTYFVLFEMGTDPVVLGVAAAAFGAFDITVRGTLTHVDDRILQVAGRINIPFYRCIPGF